ncbi:MAG: hypothetical protein RL662_621 [Bacteroidota bacterium]|jgi:Spy/CpxP family protein refolding chaperone
MKKIFLALIVVASLSLTVSASPNRDGRQGKRNNRMVEQLDLSTEQQTQLKTLNEGLRAKRETLKDDPSLTRETKRKMMAEARTTHRAEVKSILTPEQNAKWGEKKSEDKRSKENKNRKKRGNKQQWDSETTAKLDALKENFDSQKKSIEMSRIAPDAQKERIKTLEGQYREDRKKITREAKKTK